MSYISPLTSSSTAATQAAPPVYTNRTQSTASASAPKEDSVQLSAQAQKAVSRDVDHDGDSH